VLYAIALSTLGNDSKALQMASPGLKIAEKQPYLWKSRSFSELLGNIYNELKITQKLWICLNNQRRLLILSTTSRQSALIQNWIGQTYFMMNKLESALYYCQSAYENAVQLKDDDLASYVLFNLGRIEDKKGNMDSALAYFLQSLSLAWNAEITFKSCFSIAQVYQQINKPDSCIYYANKSLEVVKGKRLYSFIIQANILLSDIYGKSDPQKALQYSKMAIAYKDSLYNLGKTTSFEDFIAFDEQERQYEIDTANATYRSQIKQYCVDSRLDGVFTYCLHTLSQ
jgi:tetratricopeptide (TPR) repeat protein